MRLWSLHPQYLDSKGLVALWREALLAQKVLQGATRGYRDHPQLARFKLHPHPVAAIATYLLEVQREAVRRGYNFDKSKIARPCSRKKMAVNSGQLAYEFTHLKAKLKQRDAAAYERVARLSSVHTHPLFEEVSGPVEAWEVV